MNAKSTDHKDHCQLMIELPWLVNGTLEPLESASLRAHVAQCKVCQAEVASLTLMQQTIRDTPIHLTDSSASFDRMRQRIAAEPSHSMDNGLSRCMAWVRRVIANHKMQSWAVTAVCGVLLAAILLPLSNWSLNNTDNSYRVLSNGDNSPSVDLGVTFKEELTDAESEGILSAVTGKMVIQSNWEKIGPNTYRISALSASDEQSLSPATLKQLMDALHHQPGVKDTRVMP